MKDMQRPTVRQGALLIGTAGAVVLGIAVVWGITVSGWWQALPYLRHRRRLERGLETVREGTEKRDQTIDELTKP